MPTTGVYSGNDIAWENVDNDFIDLQYEAAVAELVASGMDEAEIEHELDSFETGTEQLYGDWLKDEAGLYGPDPKGEFAMIYDSNSNVAQVVFSRVVKFGRPASPCYPGQVDARADDPSAPNTRCQTVAYYALPTWAMREM